MISNNSVGLFGAASRELTVENLVAIGI
jgi:hypothetical protein